MDVSVIIVNFNGGDVPLACVSSIKRECLSCSFEIIVVDNASTDGSSDRLKSVFPEIRLFKTGANLGFGRANNLGAQVATGEYLFFLNPDTLLRNDAIALFLDASRNSEAKPKTGVLGSRLEDGTGRPAISSGRFDTPLSIAIRRVGSLAALLFPRGIEKIARNRYWANDSQMKCDYITGADLFMKKKLFMAAGGFDSQFFMYYEDQDLQWSISKMGFSAKIIDGPSIVHLESASSGGGIHKMSMVDSSALTFVHKRYGKTARAALGMFFYICSFFFPLIGKASFIESAAYRAGLRSDQ